jgi:DNA modification methylase
MAVACENGRKSIGIDIAEPYIKYATERITVNEQGQRVLWAVSQAK